MTILAGEETKALYAEIEGAADAAAAEAAATAKAKAMADLAAAQKVRDENVARFTPIPAPGVVVTSKIWTTIVVDEKVEVVFDD